MAALGPQESRGGGASVLSFSVMLPALFVLK